MRNGLLHWIASTSEKLIGSIWQKTIANKSSVGARGEELAEEFLRKQGMKILHRSYRSPIGEIDIIALDVSDRSRRTIVFVEVKTWTSPAQGGPADAVDERKQERLTRLALEFLKRHRLLENPARFDVVQVILEPFSLRHFPNAFEATGKYQWFS
jgi:putative endonuclease